MWTKGKYYLIGGKKYKFIDVEHNFFTPLTLIFEDENGKKHTAGRNTPEIEWKESIDKTAKLKEEITKMSEALERKRQKLDEQAKVIEKKNEEIKLYKQIMDFQDEHILGYEKILSDFIHKTLEFMKKYYGDDYKENEQAD